MNSIFEIYPFRWLIEGVVYDLAKAFVIALLSTAILKRAFGLLREQKQTVFFAVTLTIGLPMIFAEFKESFKPDLRASIRSVFSVQSDHITPPLPYRGVYTFMIAAISNLGTPAAVRSYQLDVSVGDEKYHGVPVTMGTAVTGEGTSASGHKFTMTLKGADSLFTKTISPVPTGGLIPGILLFRFDGLEDRQIIELPNARYCLIFEDVAGTWYKQCVAWTGMATEPNVVPGLDMQVEIH
jgi:hypothetical protein